MTDDSQDSPDGVSESPEPKKKPAHPTFIECCVVASIILMLIGLLSPSTRSVPEAARRTQCQNHLKQIGLALHDYLETYDAFPPAYTVDAEGKPLHSWRTLILPFLDEKPLYDKIDLSKPWDDPANVEAYQTDLGFFRCPSAVLEPTQTTYLAVVTPDSCLRPTEPRTISEIIDGASETLLAIDVAAKHAVHWMSPVDADERIVLGFGPESEDSHMGGVHVLFADGETMFLSGDTPAAERRAMISAAGNDQISGD